MAKMKQLLKKFILFFVSLKPVSLILSPFKLYFICKKQNAKRKTEYVREIFFSILFFANNSILLLIIVCVWAELFFFYFRDIKIIDMSFLWIFYEEKIITWYPYICFYYWLMLPYCILKLIVCGYYIINKDIFILNANDKIFQLFIEGSRMLFGLSWTNDDTRTYWDTVLKKPSYFILDKIYLLQCQKLFVFSWIILSNILMHEKRYPIMSFIWDIGFLFSDKFIVIEFTRYFFLIFFIWLLCLNLLFLYLKITEFFKVLWE